MNMPDEDRQGSGRLGRIGSGLMRFSTACVRPSKLVNALFPLEPNHSPLEPNHFVVRGSEAVSSESGLPMAREWLRRSRHRSIYRKI
jgi:hypothetical protein